jgi:hypothetical protein
MSYCRWSSDNFHCDLYCYEDVGGGFTTHVAANRVVGDIPKLDESAFDKKDSKAFFVSMEAQHNWLATAEHKPIGLPYDGQTFNDPDYETFIARLLHLKQVGYKFPSYVIENITAEWEEEKKKQEPPPEPEVKVTVTEAPIPHVELIKGDTMLASWDFPYVSMLEGQTITMKLNTPISVQKGETLKIHYTFKNQKHDYKLPEGLLKSFTFDNEFKHVHVEQIEVDIQEKKMVAEVKQIVQDYVLITYDIAASQGKLRKVILKKLYDMGATSYTQSVYLMPYSEASMALANEIAAGGQAVIWRSKQEDPVQADKITIKYNEHLGDRCNLIQQRLAQIKDHIEAGRLGKATRMILKTNLLLEQLFTISKTYNPPWLMPKLAGLKMQLNQVIGEK